MPASEVHPARPTAIRRPAEGRGRSDLAQGLRFSETQLTFFQRLVATTDGTVSQLLEAYAGERIRAVKLRQVFELAGAGEPELAVDEDEVLLRRSVLLQGEDTGRNFLLADSAVVPDRIHPAVREALLATDTPVAKLLAETRVETFKEVLGCGAEPAGSCARYFGVNETDPMVFRTYRIICRGRPAMLITERFPLATLR